MENNYYIYIRSEGTDTWCYLEQHWSLDWIKARISFLRRTYPKNKYKQTWDFL